MAKKSPKARVFKNTSKIHHDLYVLEPSKMIKDTSIGKTGDPDFLHPVQHQHFYHTIDSAGRPMNECSPIGGHTHLIEVIPSKVEGEPPQVICKSGPVKWAMKKNRYGKLERVMVPVNHYDDHTHEVTYLQSQEVTPRKPNVEAARVQAAIAAKESGAGVGSTEGLGAIIEG